ncbi:hypothetical protein [Crystallibacter degradans]|nr:hypothetical protein [Arthrobacter sp. SF27]
MEQPDVGRSPGAPELSELKLVTPDLKRIAAGQDAAVEKLNSLQD